MPIAQALRPELTWCVGDGGGTLSAITGGVTGDARGIAAGARGATGVTGMAAPGLKADFGSRLSFHGGVDIVGVLPKGSPEDVRRAARQLVADLGAEGGYIMASSHHIQSDTPLANVLALYELGNR